MTAIKPAAAPRPRASPNRCAAYEAVAVLVITVVPSLIWPQLKGLLSFLPIVS